VSPLPSIEEVESLRSLVVICGLAIGMGFGVLAQHARFCVLGAMSDWVVMGSATRLRAYALAMAVALMGTQALILLGLLDSGAVFYTNTRLLLASGLIGGLLFGLGMTLASGCGARTLVRIGEGSLKALVVFLVMALTAFMTFRGVVALLRTQTVDQLAFALPTRQDLPSLAARAMQSSEASPSLRLLVASLMALALLGFALWDREALGRKAREHWGAAGIGALIVISWFVTGYLGFIEEHPLTLERTYLATNSKAPEGLSFVGPLAYTLEVLIYTTDKSQTITFAIATVVGTVLGAFVSAKSNGSFRWGGFASTSDLSRHLLGAALMGIGGGTAMGCTIGHGLSGLSLLSLGSIMSTLAILSGAWIGLRLLQGSDASH